MSTVESSAVCPAIVTEIMGEGSPVIVREDGQDWVPLKPLCEGLGLNWAGERSRLKHDSKFTCRFMRLDGTDGRARDFLCLPACQLAGWLVSINADRVRDSVREMVTQFQQESLEALFGYWRGGQGDAKDVGRVVERMGLPLESDHEPIEQLFGVNEREPLQERPMPANTAEAVESLESKVMSVIENVLGEMKGRRA
ncbi:hypothetical protein DSLASN_46210 [Desulfoluna limicola]|uniref:Antirepressor protein ant N-terminal domain-containing protein n=1 Tax=Desulfoluna limicola TaxID=2810562 RepID=A0ABN6F969_9BACT|nr:phage antirepressor N-terminal domain-containing protein [Desulfoluna limicola]BCS98989.1 hypothetical protein DSLASN_46210 [Desulfoluna limicola]